MLSACVQPSLSLLVYLLVEQAQEFGIQESNRNKLGQPPGHMIERFPIRFGA